MNATGLTVLADGWSLAWTAPGAARDPAGLEALAVTWLPAGVPGTVASALRAIPSPEVGGVVPPRPVRLDAVDWWYRCTFPAGIGEGPGPAAALGAARAILRLDGLATIAEVWLNGEAILRSENMFLAHAIEVTGRLRDSNDLVLGFRAIDPWLAARRGRPRWRTPMVEHQQLRWLRTTLLGRTPGWSPPVPPVGPWRMVALSRPSAPVDVEVRELRAGVVAGDGLVSVELALRPRAGRRVRGVHVVVDGPGAPNIRTALALQERDDGSVRATGAARLSRVELWWPHTHGDQPLYHVRAAVTLDDAGAGAGGAGGIAAAPFDVALGRVGFRTLRLETGAGDFALSVNGTPIFCRGACWTPLDVTALGGSPDDHRHTLRMVREAGMNMLRVGGTMVYESDIFHDLCDELGILLWQDFMFANMDYPEEAAFVDGVRAEVRQQLARWRGRPSLALLCGDSEGEQQAAMWGAPPASWHRPLFRETLPALCHELLPDVPYWPSSASGGAFPHQPNAGSTSYYGVGAYLRPLDDARRSDVRFASESLAFANVPEEACLLALETANGGRAVRPPSPAWKAGVPRDLGAGWDFDDVRDHYLRLLFGVDPVELRSTDPERYLALGRVVTGEVMQAAFAEWRRAGSRCRGALVWFLRDLVAGAGWGVLDVGGRPKAAYHYLRRALAPLVVFLSDEGLNGLYAHVVNDGPSAWRGELRLALHRDGETRVGHGVMPLAVPPRGAVEVPAAQVLGGFVDTTYAYRFGPCDHDLAVASLVAPAGGLDSQAFSYPVGRPARREPDLGLDARVAPREGTEDWALTVSSRRFAQAVHVTVEGFEPSDDYFPVAPGGARTVVLRRADARGEPRGHVMALNARSSTRITPGGPPAAALPAPAPE